MDVIDVKHCRRKGTRKCSKSLGHPGKCDQKRKHEFWENSPVLLKKKLQDDVNQLKNQEGEIKDQIENNEHENTILKERINYQEKELDNILKNKSDVTNDLIDLQQQYEKVKVLMEKTAHGKTKRSKNPTTMEMLIETTGSTKSTRYNRRMETKTLLHYVHGGESGAVYGAWDFLISNCETNTLEELFASHKRGKFIQNLIGKFSDKHIKSEAAMKQAVATKFQGHLSRRKYQLICKIQNKVFDTDSQSWEKISVPYGELNIQLKTSSVSNANIDKFVKSLDIGDVTVLANVSGVSRTVTGLMYLIIDLNLKVKSLRDSLIWFNGVHNHFILQFSDDGAPESKEKTMTIGSLTLWNLGQRVRSREYQYLLHTVSVPEKHEICKLLWKQHSEEMALLEGNVFFVNGEKCTVEFQPSSDQAWQVWANNVLPASATYPSPFAQVHKAELTERGGSVGDNVDDRWQVPTMESRSKEVAALDVFVGSVNPSLSDQNKHKKKLEFLASNGYRQLGEPIIGIYADRQRPDPMHLEINAWEHILDLIYKEALHLNAFEQFIDILKKSPQEGGCGLSFVSRGIVEHYASEKTKYTKLSARLIGEQAIKLARYSYRLIDCLYLASIGSSSKLKCLALGKIAEYLRDIGAMISRVTVGDEYPLQIKNLCTLFFNLFSLFFADSCQITVWTIGYIIPYHVQKLYSDYKIGYGILSMQGKEGKHSELKQELKSGTNRSSTCDKTGKWYQIMRNSYVRTFYLPYHFPIATNYHSHYTSRLPNNLNPEESICNSCRVRKVETQYVCPFCAAAEDIIKSAENGELSCEIKAIFYPVKCNECCERFADEMLCKNHVKSFHTTTVTQNIGDVVLLSVTDLRKYLSERNLSTKGTKGELRNRLESYLSME